MSEISHHPTTPTGRAWTRGHSPICAAILVVGLAPLLSGCLGITTAAPPTVVCGQTISHSDDGPVLYDASKIREIKYASVDIFLQVTDDCDRGADVRWQPVAAATKVATATASDGRLAAIVLDPLQNSFTITVTGAGRSKPITIAVRLSAASTPPSPTP